jgi:hypothetical protein
MAGEQPDTYFMWKSGALAPRQAIPKLSRLYSVLKNRKKYASPWKSGPLGPRKLLELVRALAPVAANRRSIRFSANYLGAP